MKNKITNKKLAILAIALCATQTLYSYELLASRMMIGGGANCTMKENINMNINFNSMVDKATKVKDLVDGKVNEIYALAEDLGVEKIYIKSQNFNINGNRNYSSGYQYSGNMSFNVAPYDKALQLFDALQDKKYQASLNVSSYTQGNCNN